MAPRFRADIDLDFSLQEASGEETRGSVKASGTEVVVALDRIDALLSHGGCRPWAISGPWPRRSSDQGLTVVVDGPDGRIISLGTVDSSGLAAARLPVTAHQAGQAGRAGAHAEAGPRVLLPGHFRLLPPGTLLPLLPTVKRRIPRRITTTHYTRAADGRRLIFVQDSQVLERSVPA